VTAPNSTTSLKTLLILSDPPNGTERVCEATRRADRRMLSRRGDCYLSVRSWKAKQAGDMKLVKRALGHAGVVLAGTREGSVIKRLITRTGIVLLVLSVSSETSRTLDREQQRIRGVLDQLCGRCHAVTRTGRSPHPDAPPFRTFGETKLYDENFGQRLQSGLSTIHPDMPTFRFSQRDAEAAVSYLRAIQERKK
jgi:hypothetical protein